MKVRKPSDLKGFAGGPPSRATSLHWFTAAFSLFFAGIVLTLISLGNHLVAGWASLGIPPGLVAGWIVGSAEARRISRDLLEAGHSKAKRQRLARYSAIAAPFLAVGSYLAITWLTDQTQSVFGLALGGAAFAYLSSAAFFDSIIVAKTIRHIEIRTRQSVWVVWDWFGFSYTLR